MIILEHHHLRSFSTTSINLICVIECVIGAPPQVSTPYSVKTKTLNKFFNCFPAESHQVAFQFPY